MFFRHLNEEVCKLVHVARDLLLVASPDHPQAGAELRVEPAGRAGTGGEAVVVSPLLAGLESLAAVIQSLGPGETVSNNSPLVTHLS